MKRLWPGGDRATTSILDAANILDRAVALIPGPASSCHYAAGKFLGTVAFTHGTVAGWHGTKTFCHCTETSRHRTVPVSHGAENSRHRTAQTFRGIVSAVDGAETWIDRDKKSFLRAKTSFYGPIPALRLVEKSFESNNLWLRPAIRSKNTQTRNKRTHHERKLHPG